MKEKKIKILWSLVMTISLLLLWGSGTGYTAITGPCVDCHTMHNSQGGTAMATYEGETGPNSFLTRGSCVGCHAQGGSSKILTIGGSEIPQVYHTDSTELAGGNFKYIETGGDNRGHNVADIGGIDYDLTLVDAPGHHYINYRITCSGFGGCHGNRNESGLPALKGAHHGNVDGKCDTANTVANSYRFLYHVKGFENMGANKYQNLDADNHNEYYGATSPTIDHYYRGDTCSSCHTSLVPGNTTSGLCGRCHGKFHATEQIGGTTSPFIRHPSDIVIKNSGEYAAYTTYSIEAPIGRTTVPDAISSVVTPGTDVVICLSCHKAHASNYPDMLRWDYSGMIAGGGGSGGCFVCHTQKND